MNYRVAALSICSTMMVATLLIGGTAHGTAWVVAQPLRDCGTPPVGGGPKNDRYLNIPDIKARGLTCRVARTAIRAGTFTIHGCFGQPGRCYATFRTPHFRCKEAKAGSMRCTPTSSGRSGRMFEFRWGE